MRKVLLSFKIILSRECGQVKKKKGDPREILPVFSLENYLNLQRLWFSMSLDEHIQELLKPGPKVVSATYHNGRSYIRREGVDEQGSPRRQRSFSIYTPPIDPTQEDPLTYESPEHFGRDVEHLIHMLDVFYGGKTSFKAGAGTAFYDPFDKPDMSRVKHAEAVTGEVYLSGPGLLLRMGRDGETETLYDSFDPFNPPDPTGIESVLDDSDLRVEPRMDGTLDLKDPALDPYISMHYDPRDERIHVELKPAAYERMGI